MVEVPPSFTPPGLSLSGLSLSGLSLSGLSPSLPPEGADRPDTPAGAAQHQDDLPFGSWASPISADDVAAQSGSIGELRVGDGALFWSESRPNEGGRIAIVRHRVGAGDTDVIADAFSARNRVHEYGGGAWWLDGNFVFFTNWTDGRIYRVIDDRPTPLSPEDSADRTARFADGRVTMDGRWIIAVRELHDASLPEAINEIVAVDAHREREPVILVSGPDFVSSPRPSPDGRQICWLQWNHPDMPWDGTELWVADIEDSPEGIGLIGLRLVAGSRDESICEPSWLRDGSLVFLSDRSDWWNLYRVDPAAITTATADPAVSVPIDAVAPVAGEIGRPAWVFGQSRYAELEDGRLLCAVASGGVDRLGVVDLATDGWTWLDLPFTSIDGVVAYGLGAAVLGGSFVDPSGVWVLDLDDATHPTASRVSQIAPHPSAGSTGDLTISVAEPITFPTTAGGEAHAMFYAPRRRATTGTSPGTGERPPLIVMSHGGPTSSARSVLHTPIQFWTTRGFAVVDVNYRGSTGYGRAYRHGLDGEWGIYDVDDCVAAATFLAQRGDVDPARLAIRGGSAGGFTTLCALTFHDVFRAGASLYGVADLEALARDTHKFESRYLDRLIGPWPAESALYAARSPIHHTDQLSAPLILLQGLEDAVVPPAQAEAMVAALDRKGIPYAYVPFEGEQHGFRRAESISRALEAELSFYGRIFGFDVAGDIEPVQVENL